VIRQWYSANRSFFFCFWARQPAMGQGLLFHEASRSHTKTHHSRYDSSGRVISSSQRPLPDDTQYSQTTNIRWDPNPQSQQATGHRPRLRPRGHWYTNRSTRKKTCPIAIPLLPHPTNHTFNGPGLNQCLRDERPETNSLNYGRNHDLSTLQNSRPLSYFT